MFGESEPTLFGRVFSIILAFSYHLGAAGFVAMIGKEYVGEFSKKMINALFFRGMVPTALVKGGLSALFFVWVGTVLFSQDKLGHAYLWVERTFHINEEYLMNAYIFLRNDGRLVAFESAVLVVVSTALFLLIPYLAIRHQIRLNNSKDEDF